MIKLTKTHLSSLNEAFAKLLGAPSEGSMAYTRCLPPEAMIELIGAARLQISQWSVYAVDDKAESKAGYISADQAIDLRELKRGSILLLVDEARAGAGIDGVYSAVREIKERELFERASKAAQKRLSEKLLTFATIALREAKRVGRANTISPWAEFDFFARCAETPKQISQLISLLGLWPLSDAAAGPRSEDLSVTARVVERLLLAPGSPLSARLQSLLLPSKSNAEKQRLEELQQLLRQTESLHWREAVTQVKDRPNLWLGALQPGFSTSELKALELVPWLKAKGAKPLSWSGLELEESGLIFKIDPENKERSKLTVRWRSLPADLKAGALEYKVCIMTGAETELVSRQVAHSGKETQQCVFRGEDFSELDEDGKWEAVVRVQPAGAAEPDSPEQEANQIAQDSIEFILTFGSAEQVSRSSVGKKVRALVDETIRAESEALVTQLCAASAEEDRAGYIRAAGVKARVYRPRLIKELEQDWQSHHFAIGRWIARVRPDGSLASGLRFEKTPHEHFADSQQKLEKATRELALLALKRCGFIGLVHHGLDESARYVNAWAAALETSHPSLALAHTLEIQSQAGKTIGLIVLPSHPIRVAWHEGYDELAFYARYKEGLSPIEVSRVLNALDGSYAPMFLPGIQKGESFIFADVLGFYAVAMTRYDEPEPQACIALLNRCLSGSEEVSSSAASSTASVVSKEIGKYNALHPEYSQLSIHALRSGDAKTVAHALGLALQDRGAEPTALAQRGYVLDLFPSPSAEGARVLGSFLANVAERRRAGVALAHPEDRWINETYELDGVRLPRLKWAKRATTLPQDPAHLSLSFDAFDSTVEIVASENMPRTRATEVFGLTPTIVREFRRDPLALWTTTVALDLEGEKHPLSKGLSDRLNRIQSALMKAVTFHLSGARDGWPVLMTRVSPEKQLAIKRLHELSDWVITIDRNAGVEYFDDPKQADEIYRTYLIDCVPERQDLDGVQLMTSTCHVEEVGRLLEQLLAEMSLSNSPRSCELLLSQLKALSGRLAMRLVNHHQNAAELIALALFYEQCASLKDNKDWPSLESGFLVPLDDVRELLLPSEAKEIEGEDNETQSRARADLVYVELVRNSLQFTILEIKYRRSFRLAVDPGLRDYISEQTQKTKGLLQHLYFSSGLKKTQLAVRRKRLVRALQFYLEKARRHKLLEEPYKKLSLALDRLLRDVEPPVNFAKRGYIFCPEHNSAYAEIGHGLETRIFLFGPRSLLSAQEVFHEEPASTVLSIKGPGALPETTSEPPNEVQLYLGDSLSNEEPVHWSLSVKANPHLMVAGLPGMGKTTCLIRLCEQLSRAGIVPLIFSYHEDIEEQLRDKIGPIRFIDPNHGLGFNPFRVVTKNQLGWIDNVSMLRDIFASIYHDFGDRQTNEIRESIKQAYLELGYGGSEVGNLPTPSFRRFYEIIKNKTRPNPGILARLEELNDYNFFEIMNEQASILDSKEVTVFRIHGTQSEVLQKAMSSFYLFNIYQGMFLRGPQERIRNAIVFDEAHRASTLKLLPMMAKESRKFGVSLIVASQEAKDFNPSLYSSIANYLVLRVNEADARVLARTITPSEEAPRVTGRLKQLEAHTAGFFRVGARPVFLRLSGESANVQQANI